MKRIIIALMLMGAIVAAESTYLRVTDGVIVVTDGVIQTGAATPAGTDYANIPQYANSVLLCEFTNSAATIADNSYYGLQAITNCSPPAASTWANTTGVYSAYRDFDGGDKVVIEDNNNLSFGNASADSPFTLSAWCNMNDATKFRIMCKATDTDAGTLEWVFINDANDKLGVGCYDHTATDYILATATDAITSDENTWHCYTATYNGSGLASGFNLYRDGIDLANTGATGGSYTAMHNTPVDATIGAFLVDSPAVTYANGSIDMPMIWSVELSSNEVFRLFRNTNWQNPTNGYDIGGASPIYINPGKGFAAP